MNIYLTSSVAYVADDLYTRFLEKENHKTVLFIDTAAEPEVIDRDDDWLALDLESLCRQGYQVDRFSITGKTKEEINQTIDQYDILYMCGGTTAHLLDQIHATGCLELIKEKVLDGKPYIGTSAGSIVAGKRLPKYLLVKDMQRLVGKPGFGFVDFTILPHWGCPEFKTKYLEDRLGSVFTEEMENPILILTDYQYVVLKDGVLEVISTKTSVE